MHQPDVLVPVIWHSSLAATITDEGADDVELINRIGGTRSRPHHRARCRPYRIHGGSISSKRYMLQQHVFEFVSARNQARLRGSDLSVETYQRNLHEQPALRRLARGLGNLGRSHYRNTVVHLAERHFLKAICSAGMAIACNPLHALYRTRNRLSSN